MRLTHSIQSRIVFMCAACLIGSGLLTGGYSVLTLRSTARDSAEQQALAVARGEAGSAQARIHEAIQTAQGLAQIFAAVKDPNIKLDLSRDAARGILQSEIESNPDYLGVFSVWEVDAFDDMDVGYSDTAGHDGTGRFIPHWVRGRDGQVRCVATSDYQNGNYYAQTRDRKAVAVLNPVPLPQHGGAPVIRVVAPVMEGKTFHGLVGIELPTTVFQGIADELAAFAGTAELALLSSNGTILASTDHPDRSGAALADHPALSPLQESLGTHEQGSFVTDDALWCVAPVTLSKGDAPWTVAIRVPLQQVNAASNALVWKQGGLAILTVLIAIGLALTLARSVVRPIRAVAAVMDDIAQGDGDLTRRLNTDGLAELADLSRAFNAFAGKVHDIMVQVDGVTRSVASASTEISASTEEVAAGMGEQSGQVEQITSAIEQMTLSVSEVARKSIEATRCAEASGTAAEKGGSVVQETVSGINAIHDAVTATAASVTELGKRGGQIGQIIAVINDIADQTNLLALNAAIEAARAGEHGRGFAVVADEVRKLADRTTMATREVASSIEAIQHETAQAVERMDAGTSQVARGVESATQAGESLRQIVTGAREVAGMIQAIAAAAEEQSVAGAEVRRYVDAVSAVTQQTSAGAADAARAVAELSSQAADLQRLIARFKLDRQAMVKA